MDSLKNGLQLLFAALLLLFAVFLVRYLLFETPSRFAEPDGLLVRNRCERLVEA